MKQEEIIAALPSHLRPFVSIQNYSHYSPRDQAVWRFIMRQLVRQLNDSAHPVYRLGLEKTGISLDHVPSLDEMNSALAAMGWAAVVVDGFVPPAIFMEFQARKILVIALDMRSVDHLFYTPAPDIVHESAGHAPFLVDVDYAEFLQRFGEVGMKAIPSRHDLAVYEAVRALSIAKECPASSELEVERAQQRLDTLLAEPVEPSEATLLARLHWWTVEYGLVGEVDDYRIFGAGLLSSLGESRHCLDDAAVPKLPLTVNAVDYPYDITSQQRQLFVTKSCRHLSQVLEEFAASMGFVRGGAESLRKAITSGTVCTAELDSGVQISGRMAEVHCDAVGNAIYLRTEGPTQLAWREREIYGHGSERHPEGFGSPIGRIKDFSRCLSEYSVDELKAHDVVLGDEVRLEFLSGITVSGQLTDIFRREHRNLILTFTHCTVTDLQGRVLFDPAWGDFDMAVGAAILSVYGGAADRDKYRIYDAPAIDRAPAPAVDARLMELYARATPKDLAAVECEQLIDAAAHYPDEWLLRVELLNSRAATVLKPALGARLRDELKAIAGRRPDLVEAVSLALS